MAEGNSKEMEAKFRALPEGELVEIADRNDSSFALKARAELARRNSRFNKLIILWAVLAGVAAMIGVGFEL